MHQTIMWQHCINYREETGAQRVIYGQWCSIQNIIPFFKLCPFWKDQLMTGSTRRPTVAVIGVLLCACGRSLVQILWPA